MCTTHVSGQKRGSECLTLPLPAAAAAPAETPAKRGRFEGAVAPAAPRLRSWEEVQAFTAGAGVRCVVVTGGWVRKASAAALAAMQVVEQQGYPGAVAHVSLDEDDASGVIAFEAKVPKAPCVLMYHDGRALPVFTSVDFAAAGVVEEVRGAIAAEVAVPPITSTNHFHDLIRGDEYTVFDFYAPWCAPCNRIKPHLPELASSFPNCKFFKVNFDHYPNLRAECNVLKIPTFVVYKNGEMMGSLQHSDPAKVSSFISEKTSNFMSFDEDF